MKIGKKEHFGERELKKAVIPPGTEELEAWAYGACVNLKEVWLPAGISLSGKAFEGSGNIERVCIYSNEEELKAGRHINSLEDTLALALLVWSEDMTGLLEDYSDEKLISFIADKLPAYLEEADDKGFEPFLAGGEEDYGDEVSEREKHISGVRLRKVRLSLDAMLLGEADHCSYIRHFGTEILLSVLKIVKKRREDYVSFCFEKELFDTDELNELPERAAEDAELKAMLIKHLGKGSDMLSDLRI